MNRKLIDRANYFLSKEKGTVHKDPGGRISIVLAYPNIYSVGMSSLGFQGIYGLLNGIKDVVCERVFLPDVRYTEEFERTGTELFSLESKRPLSRFDIIAFSVSFENDYPNIRKMLGMSRIPLRSSRRNNRHPLLIMGGVCACYNPEPLAEFFDVCFIGEAEEMLPEFLSVYRDSKSREALFESALKIEGLYIPRYYSVEYGDNGQIEKRSAENGAPGIIKKRTVEDISENPLRTAITTPEAEFSDMYLAEAMRGCLWSCRFCVAGHIYRPSRKKKANHLKAEIQEALSMTNRVGLIGPSLSDYPYSEEVLSVEGVDFSITSLRASPRSGQMIKLLRNHKSVSIAPETGSERLRMVINKKIKEGDILETSKLIFESGIETLRLYFMIGLPTETEEDVEAIVGLVNDIRDISKKGFITLSISTFVPKPFTPFQWHPMEFPRVVKERLKIIKRGVSRVKGTRIFHDVPKYSYHQGVFALGDRRVSELIETSASGSNHPEKHDLPKKYQDFFVFRKKEKDEILPWDFIDTGISKGWLWEEYQRAIRL
jgi:radical SAM superfamily enzyme YgiQ (UPF0313 family)